MSKINIEALAQELLFLETHAQAIRKGEIENNWDEQQWAYYRRQRNTYNHFKEREKKKRYERVDFQKIRRYNDSGVRA